VTPFLAFFLGVALTVPAVLTAQRAWRWRERTRAEDSSDDSSISTIQQVLHLVTQGSPTGIVVVSRTGNVMLSNARAHDMSLVHDGTVNPRVFEVAEEVLGDLEERTLDMELPQRTTGSRIRNVRAIVAPLTLTENTYAIVYGSDESENVRMEHARRDFVANVSHELKTPVGGMSLLAEALLQDPGDPETVEYFGGKLQKEALRMGDMITDLINLSRLQGAEALPEMAPMRIDDVIEDAVARNLVTAENRSNTRFWSSGAMPMPRSVTRTSTTFSRTTFCVTVTGWPLGE
jgi:two-component system, OmpR family, sensor histidine kinase SenX3